MKLYFTLASLTLIGILAGLTKAKNLVPSPDLETSAMFMEPGLQAEYWRLVNGEAEISIPHIGAGFVSSWRLQISFTDIYMMRHHLNLDDYVAICDSRPFLFISDLIRDINVQSHVHDVFAYHVPFTNTIRVAYLYGPIEFVNRNWLFVSPSQFNKTEWIGGSEDSFDKQPPLELAIPDNSNGFEAWLGPSNRNFDEDMLVAPFGHTVTAIDAGNKNSDSVYLEIRMKALHPLANNDIIGLEFDGQSGFVWFEPIAALPEANGRWELGKEAIFCLDLSGITNAEGFKSDSLFSCLRDGKLDVFVSDNTAIDYVAVQRFRCQ